MLGYRRHAFRRAHALLRAIELNREDLGSLKVLQLLLIDEIKRAERQVRTLKTELRELAAVGTARKRKSLERRISEAQSVIFVWKCFGDGIAFSYMDKYALKHTYLNTANRNPKQTAGFLLGKAGFEAEWSMLESALAAKVPAILTDLTNTIRHGDLCLMGENDPYLIEIKSAKTKNTRLKRQKRDLQILREFYENDHSDRLRGMSSVYREEHVLPEVAHGAALNAAIEQALTEDVAIARPEKGLIYIVLRTKAAKIDEAFAKVDLDAPWMFSLNGAKMERAWAPYYPFTLTIRDANHLWAFVRGDIFLMVFVSLRNLETIGSRDGCTSTFDQNDEFYPLSVNLPHQGGTMRIANQALARIGFECVSPDWLITNSVESWKRGVERAKDDPATYVQADGSNIDPLSRKYMEEAGFSFMENPQQAVLDIDLNGSPLLPAQSPDDLQADN